MINDMMSMTRLGTFVFVALRALYQDIVVGKFVIRGRKRSGKIGLYWLTILSAFVLMRGVGEWHSRLSSILAGNLILSGSTTKTDANPIFFISISLKCSSNLELLLAEYFMKKSD